MATIFVHNLRNDGKYKVTYSYSNGVHLHKLRTHEQLLAEKSKGYEWYGLSIMPKDSVASRGSASQPTA